MKPYVKRLAVIGSVTVGLAGVAVPAASAAGIPSSGYSCGWADLSYSGSYYCVSLNKVHWSAFPNTATSVGANGASCDHTRF